MLIIVPVAPVFHNILPLHPIAVKIATSFSHKLGLLLVIIGVNGFEMLVVKFTGVLLTQAFASFT